MSKNCCINRNDALHSALKDLWEQTVEKKTNENSSSWEQQLKSIYECGKGLEETIRFLYAQRPSLEKFLEWIMPQRSLKETAASIENVLMPEDIRFFKTTGYVVVKNAVPKRQCLDVRVAILEHLGADINDPVTWYKDHDDVHGLMLMFYHHPALEANRNSAMIRKAYEQLYETTSIHMVVEKVSFNPPETSLYKFKGSPLHWDVSLVMPIPFKLQGLLYLNDVETDGGAFHCVPGFHNEIERWLNGLPENINPRDEAIRTLYAQPVTGKAGDFIIWHQALPHCATPNRSNTPRFVQYHTYDPDNLVTQDVWK